MDYSEHVKKLYAKIVNFVSLRSRSKKEVDDRLRKYISALKTTYLDRDRLFSDVNNLLTADNFIDDARFAAEAVAALESSTKPRGRIYAKRFLLKKGIPNEIIDRVVSGYDEELELSAGIALAEKKLKILRNKNQAIVRNKLWTALTYRGFPSSIIQRVIDITLGVK